MASSSTHRRARRSQQYLNGILTVNAVLLACLVWTNISSGPSRADAAPMLPQVQDDVQTGGVPNAAAQRERTISEIRALREDLRQLEQGMTSGKIKVNIGNLADLKKLMDESAAKSAAARCRRRLGEAGADGRNGGFRREPRLEIRPVRRPPPRRSPDRTSAAGGFEFGRRGEGHA
jgi:hypothetical protein